MLCLSKRTLAIKSYNCLLPSSLRNPCVVNYLGEVYSPRTKICVYSLVLNFSIFKDPGNQNNRKYWIDMRKSSRATHIGLSATTLSLLLPFLLSMWKNLENCPLSLYRFQSPCGSAPPPIFCVLIFTSLSTSWVTIAKEGT